MPMVRHITAIWRTNDQIGNQSGVRAASQLSVRPYGGIRVVLGIVPVVVAGRRRSVRAVVRGVVIRVFIVDHTGIGIGVQLVHRLRVEPVS